MPRGARVLELAGEATAPCGRLLAEAGLDVVLIEPAGGASSRRGPDGELGSWSLFHDLGKRSVELELESEEGAREFLRLVEGADVVLESMAPGALAAMGLGFEVLQSYNAGIVLASITPFGQGGPYRDFQGGDLVVSAMGGVMYISGSASEPPVVPPDRQSHVLAGTHAATAIQAVLWRRQQDGIGDWIDISEVECWAAQENTVTNFLGPGQYARRAGSQHRTSLPGRIFRCADGFVHIFVSREKAVWERFLDWLGRPDALADPALADINTRWQSFDLVDSETERLVAPRGRLELFESGQALHLPVVPVLEPGAFLEDSQTTALAPVVTVDHPDGGHYRSLSPPLPKIFGITPRGAPAAGAHTVELLAQHRAHERPTNRREEIDRRLLRGVRVCALTHVAAGPYATLQLSALGADVLKIESRTRVDYWRYRDRNNDPERSRPFADHNKDVRSVCLNLRTDEGRATAKRLAAECDVVIDNFSAGVTDRLGLGYEDLRALRADTIVVHLTGLGSVGPRSGCVTFGPSLMSYSGVTHLWNHPDPPVPVGSQSSYPDYLAGAYAAYAIVSALRRREETGEGILLDLSQALITAASIGPSMVSALAGETVAPVGNTSASHAPYGCYRCAGEDAWCVIAVRTQQAWDALVELLGRPAWTREPWAATAAGRVGNRRHLDELVGEWTKKRRPREVMQACQAAGVPAGAVATGEDIVEDSHLASRNFLVEREHPALGLLRLPGPAMRFARSSTKVGRFGPLLGHDTTEVLQDVLGLDEHEVGRLEASGALQ